MLRAKITFLVVVLSLLFMGCGQGFKSVVDLKQAKNGACAPSICGTEPVNPEDPWSKVDLSGTVEAGPFGTHKVIDVDKVNNLLLISLPLPVNPFGGMTISKPIPELPGAEVRLEQSGSSYALVLAIPLKYVVRGVEFADPGKLPNGDPLPGIPGGELPKLGLKLNRDGRDVFLYLGKGAVGVFVPTPEFDPFLNLTFPIKNKSQRRIIGYFATVSKKGTSAGGFFMSVLIPADIQRIIDDIIP